MAIREVRLDAARKRRHGLLILSFEQLAVRLAGGFASPIDVDSLRSTFQAVWRSDSWGERMSEQIKISQQFVLQFYELKKATNDNTKTLINFFQKKQSLRDMAGQLYITARDIEFVISVRKIHPQISSSFIALWKDYVYVWKAPVEYPMAEIFQKAGTSEATYFNWKKGYGGLLPKRCGG